LIAAIESGYLAPADLAGRDPVDFSAPLAEPLLLATQPWQNFYILAGTAAATLAGLMFVAVTFGSTAVRSADMETARAFVDPTYGHFFQVLVTACVMLMPTLRADVLAWLLLTGTLLRIAGVLWVYRHYRRAHRLRGDIEVSDWAMAIDGLAIATVSLLAIGVRSAWELLVWLAIEARRPEGGGGDAAGERMREGD
jgi:hypothetical protein